MDGEVAFVFTGGTGDDEAEESFSDAGEDVVVLHAVGRQGRRVDGDPEVVLHVEGVHAGAIEGDGEDVIPDGCLWDVPDDAPCSGIDLLNLDGRPVVGVCCDANKSHNGKQDGFEESAVSHGQSVLISLTKVSIMSVKSKRPVQGFT